MVNRLCAWGVFATLTWTAEFIAAEDAAASQALEPAAALRSFDLPPGFTIELVASEPLVRDPVALSFDEHGRLFVVEYPEFNQYSVPADRHRRGAVRLLTDTDRDGRYDKATTFVADLDFPTSVICSDGGVLIGAPPHVYFCRDVDDDGVADRRDIVLTGFARDFAGGGLLNSFRWSIDNRIHMATGFAGGDVRSAVGRGQRSLSVRGQGLVFDPRTREFTATSGGGQHGLGIDDWGRKFLCSNVRPIQQLAYDATFTARNPFFSPRPAAIDINEAPRAELHRLSPLESWRRERSRQVAATRGAADEGAHPGGRFTSASGVTIFRGDAWPVEYRGNLFVGEVANNLVYRAKLTANGIPFRAQRADPSREFLASRDPWFRPVQLANGHDGCLYVIDMYRELIEGSAFVPPDLLEKLDPLRGSDRGRIYRLRASTAPARRGKWPGELTTAELVQELGSLNGWRRDTASRLLTERRDPDSTALLRRAVLHGRHPLNRGHALHVLATLDRLTADLVLAALDDDSPDLRVHAVRLSASHLDSPTVLARLQRMDVDPNPEVRRELAQTLGYANPAAVRATLARLLRRDCGDPWLRIGVQSSLQDGAGAMLALLSQDSEFLRQPAAGATMAELANQVAAKNQQEEVLLMLLALQRIPTERLDIQRSVLATVAQRSPELRSQVLDATGWQKSIERLIANGRKTITDGSQSLQVRRHSLRALALLEAIDEPDAEIFRSVLHWRQPTAMQVAAVDVLEQIGDDRLTPQLLQDALPNLGPRAQAAAYGVLFSRADWALRVLRAGQTDEPQIGRSQLELLRFHTDPQVQAIAVKRLGQLDSSPREQIVRTYTAALASPGDANVGRELFRMRCATCHEPNKPSNQTAGPALAGVGVKAPSVLLVHILDPNRDVHPRYYNHIVETKDGRVLAGVLSAETANGMRLRRADGKSFDLLRKEIASIKNTGQSFMPVGLEKQISPQQMPHLLAYLKTLR